MECPHCGAPLSASYLRSDEGRTCPVCGGRLTAAPAAPVPQAPAAVVAPEAALKDAWEQEPPASWAAGETDADLSGPAYVCLTEERKINPLAVGPLLERFAGLGRADARHHAAHGKGLIAEGLSLDRARSLVAALRGEGIEAFALSAARVPRELQEVHIARIHGAEDDALHLEVTARGEVKAVPWSRLVAGLCTRMQFPGRERVAVEVDRPVPIAGAGMGMGWVMDSETVHVDRAARPVLCVTLVFSGRPDTAHFVQFGEGDVRYAYLGARVLPAQHQNLCLLLRDIAEHCPHGFFPAGYQAAAGGATRRVPKVLGKLDYGHYVQWGICCAAARNLFQTGGGE